MNYESDITDTLKHFIAEIPDKLEAILSREIVSSKCGEYTIERTMRGVLMSSAFALKEHFDG